jgi:hypothetical protein
MISVAGSLRQRHPSTEAEGRRRQAFPHPDVKIIAREFTRGISSSRDTDQFLSRTPQGAQVVLKGTPNLQCRAVHVVSDERAGSACSRSPPYTWVAMSTPQPVRSSPICRGARGTEPRTACSERIYDVGDGLDHRAWPPGGERRIHAYVPRDGCRRVLLMLRSVCCHVRRNTRPL